MIIKLLLVLKKWALLIVVIYATVLTIASLIHLGGVPSLGSSFDDKIYHFIAYFLFTVLVYNYCKVRQFKNANVISAVVVIVYGIIIEVLQQTITSYRTLDIYDVFANALGVVVAISTLKFRTKLKLK